MKTWEITPIRAVFPKDFQNKLTEFLTTRKSGLLAKIQKEKALSDALTAELKAAATEFKQTYK